MTSMLNGKVVMIAGASSGMGRATALLAARQGARVVLIARNADALDSVAREVKEANGEAIACPADATDQDAVDTAVRRAVDTFGQLNALVNSVGTNIKERSLDVLTRENWQRLLATNLDAAFVLTRATLPVFRQRGDGLLIHISSSAAKKADMAGVAYHASKAGMAGLAHATMEEERANGIRSSVIFPGLTNTPLVDKRPTPVPDEIMIKALQPEDVAQMCVCLLALPARAYVPELLLYPSQH